MTLINKGMGIVRDVKTFWRVPAKGEYVAYKEYLMLSVGWLGMRLATVFGIGFGINDAFTAMTLHMNHRDLLIFGYICTAIGYALAPLNAYIIDNLRSRVGKYKVYVKLGVPAGILSLLALFFPYEKLGYFPMVLSLFLIGQIQGYVQGWYNTGVSNLVYVISPNSRERVKIMMVTSLVHNFAPSLTGLLIPILSDVFANGDLYNINTYRMVYPFFIVIGVGMSLTAYFGVQERIIQPRSVITNVGLVEALRAVSHNKLFWIKCSDSWNNFMEDCKNILLQWVFYYGKAGSKDHKERNMSLYGIIDTVSYNSSMWAMLFSPWLIDKLGKRGFKLVKNISQIFITLGLALTYKKSIAFIGIFYFLNRFWETTEVIDRSIESDIRDYQQYLSGERIDGAFGVVETYVGGAVGALTNLFIPWVYKKNGFDGTDYSVLEVYDDNGRYRQGNVLYKLLDRLMVISLVGAAIDVVPWFFYDLTEARQKSVIRIIRIRSAIEDKKAGFVSDELYCEACEAVIESRKYFGLDKKEKPDKKSYAKSEFRTVSKETAEYNEQVEISEFVGFELDRFNTAFGAAYRDYCEKIVGYGKDGFIKYADEITALAKALPAGETKEEKAWRRDAVNNAKSVRRAAKNFPSYYPNGLNEFNVDEFEGLFDLPTENSKQRAEKRQKIRKARSERNSYGKVMKPYLFAQRNVLLANTYDDIDLFLADYSDAAARLDEKREKQRREEELAAANHRISK